MHSARRRLRLHRPRRRRRRPPLPRPPPLLRPPRLLVRRQRRLGRRRRRQRPLPRRRRPRRTAVDARASITRPIAPANESAYSVTRLQCRCMRTHAYTHTHTHARTQPQTHKLTGKKQICKYAMHILVLSRHGSEGERGSQSATGLNKGRRYILDWCVHSPTPSPTPDPTPSPTPSPTPAPTPDPTPAPTAGPTPRCGSMADVGSCERRAALGCRRRRRCLCFASCEVEAW